MIFKSVLAAGVLTALTATNAAATAINLPLTGNVANFFAFQVPIGNLIYDEHFLPLGAVVPFTVNAGDTVNATVTLDHPYTMPASADWTGFGLILAGTSFPLVPTQAHGTFRLFDGSTQVADLPYLSLSFGAVGAGGQFFPPTNTAYTFDSFTVDVNIDQLSQPTTVNFADFDYSLVSSVPEPSVWLMLITGIALTGWLLRHPKTLE